MEWNYQKIRTHKILTKRMSNSVDLTFGSVHIHSEFEIKALSQQHQFLSLLRVH